ncbi:MAG: 6-carboxytetrahydropterin synthase QueD [Candidatus Sericytochromatia bacterium]|nr:6-carboxytetrahydropterin synthase QueD [Candidatus Sericytochromatia bacterium]
MDFFELSIELEFCAAHILVGHQGKCANLHGHNYKAEVCLSGSKLDSLGILIDFSDLKKIVNNVLDILDHHYINEIDYPAFLEGKTSAENIAKFIYENIETKIDQKISLDYVKLYETSKYSVKYSKK